MKKFFQNIRKYYKYAIRSAKAELKSEVADSYLNWLWWVIEPFAFMVIYSFVFGVIFKSNEQYFASFVMVGLAAWDFFNRMITGSVKLITNNRDLVTKVYVPKYILLLAKSFTYLFKFFISLGLAFGLMFYQHVPFTWNMLLIFPVIIVLYIVSFGCGMILMHFGVSFNDLSNLTNIALRMVFYLSGIFYNITKRLKGRLGWVLLRFNPIACMMNELRKATVYGKMISFELIGFWLVIGLILCCFGVHVIHKNENSYAKVI
jgi:ABC-type polysaccharide/polyol phosphate export permease